MFVWVRLHISNKIKTNILGEKKNVENNNKSNGRKLLKMMYTCICVQMCSKSCSLATNTHSNKKKRHSYNSGDSLGGHKSKDDHRKSEPAKKHTHITIDWTWKYVYGLYLVTHAKKREKKIRRK